MLKAVETDSLCKLAVNVVAVFAVKKESAFFLCTQVGVEFVEFLLDVGRKLCNEIVNIRNCFLFA